MLRFKLGEYIVGMVNTPQVKEKLELFWLFKLDPRKAVIYGNLDY